MKEKSNKGITLVALIITIIILLILAVVAISAVTGNGIIAHAKNARDLYEVKSKEENALLQNYLEQLQKNNPGKGEEQPIKNGFVVPKGAIYYRNPTYVQEGEQATVGELKGYTQEYVEGQTAEGKIQQYDGYKYNGYVYVYEGGFSNSNTGVLTDRNRA